MSFDPAPDLPVRNLPPAEGASPPQQRLSIAHLMLWTLGTCWRCRGWRYPHSRPHSFFGDSSPNRLQTYFRVMAIVTAPFSGIAVAFLLVSIWKLYHKQPLWLAQPGHWILLIGGISFVLTAVGQLIQFLLAPLLRADGGTTGWLVLTQLSTTALSFVLAVLSFVAFRRTAGPPRWKFYFASSAALYAFVVCAALILLATLTMHILMSITFVLAIVALPIYLACLVSFPYAVFRDLSLKEYRDGLHWAGVALVIVAFVSTVGQAVALSVLI